MQDQSVLIVGGGIGGLTAAIALLEKGHRVEVVERDADWTTYGVGIIQQFNVIRAMASIGMLDAYLAKAFGFDRTTIFVGPGGAQAADFDTPRLAGDAYPSNAGIRRTDLQDVLVKGATDRGAKIRLGTTVEALHDDGEGVDVTFSDGSTARYDMVVGADGVFSKTRGMILPDTATPRYTGQWVWRYNLPKPDDLVGIQVFAGPCNAGLVPLGQGLMYMFLLSQEEPGMKLAPGTEAATMRDRFRMAPPQIAAYRDAITDDAAVVGRPLEVVFVEGDWHRGRVVLLGDAIHASTPHLAQGAGMAIEDGLVLADELTKGEDYEAIFTAYRARRFDRVAHVARTSILIGDAQMGLVPPVNVPELNGQTIGMMAQPI